MCATITHSNSATSSSDNALHWRYVTASTNAANSVSMIIRTITSATVALSRMDLDTTFSTSAAEQTAEQIFVDMFDMK
eukprot:229841-Amorphochlora_amoeboformis.AAC.1